MPLIALDILETKIKELLVVISHLREENAALKDTLRRSSSGDGVSVSPEIITELESLKKQVEKYKNDRSKAAVKLSSAIKQVEEMIERGKNG